MTQTWVRILLGVVGVLVLAVTVPAIFVPSANPVLAEVTSHTGLSAVFISRQATIAVVVLYCAWKGIASSVFLGGLLVALFNLFDTIGILLLNGITPILVPGLVLLAIGALVMARARAPQS